MRRLKVLLVDDQKLFVESLRKVLESVPDRIESVDIAYNGREAVEYLKRARPQIVLMDTHMPVMDGISATRVIHKRFPEVKILMLSAFGYDEYVQEAMSCGASGYILKDISPDELLESIQAVTSGNVILSKEVISSISGKAEVIQEPSSVPDWLGYLSSKEKKILLLISRGYSNKEIADTLHLGSQTVRNYISVIYDKLGVKDRFEAMRQAIEARIERLVKE
jgi:DNA-binding NarL/FixJ family response regulator